MQISDVILFGICHESATLNLREKVSLSEDVCCLGMGRLVCAEDISEIVIYSTCNRVEFVLAAGEPVKALAEIKAFIKECTTVTDDELESGFYTLQGLAAVRHFLASLPV